VNHQSKTFLVGTLGKVGAKAMLKALEKSPELESAILPRTALSWVSLLAKTDLPANIPGLDAKLTLKKTESGYDGEISSGFAFKDSSLTHVAAALSVALDFSYEKMDHKLSDLVRLGKSIDLLVKANFVDQIKSLQKVTLNDGAATQAFAPHTPPPEKTAEVHSSPAGDLNGVPVYHHVYKGPQGAVGKSVVHAISTSKDPHDKQGTLGSIHGVESPVQDLKDGDGIGKAPWNEGSAFMVGKSAVRSDARGQGVGHLLYSKALQHHGRMVSDSYVSSGAGKVWGKLLGSPGVSGALGKEGDPSDVHWAETPTLGKGEKGAAAAPQSPGAPMAPQAPSRKQPSLKSPKPPTVPLPKVQKSSDGSWSCTTCGGKNSINNSKLSSCICWRDLAKDVKLEKTEAGYDISFGKKWDKDSFDLWVSELRFNL